MRTQAITTTHDTAAEIWTAQLDNMGPFAPEDELRAHLAAAPAGCAEAEYLRGLLDGGARERFLAPTPVVGRRAPHRQDAQECHAIPVT